MVVPRTSFSASRKEYEKNWPQILAILISGLAGLNNGLLFSWASPFLIKITNDTENYNITEEQASYLNTIQPLALIIACPIFAKLSDRIGRKKTLLLIVIPQALSWLLAGFAKSVYVFYAARICSGISDGCLFATLPVYIGEIANPSVRETWGNVIPTAMYLGEFLITAIGSYLGVTTTSIVCLPLPFLFLILFWMMPESPYFYIIKGEEENAKKALRFLKRLKDIDDLYVRVKCDVKRQLSESGSWSDLIKVQSNRKALLAGLFLRISQQFSGLTIFITYTQFIFQKSGDDISHELASILYMSFCILMNFVAVTLIIPRFGRVICYISSTSSCGVILLAMTIYFYINDNLNVNLSAFNWIPVTGMVLHVGFSSFGISVIPTLMLSELYSASIKSKAMTVLVIAFGMGNFITTLIFYHLNSLFGLYAPFFFFTICCLASTVISYFVIPETKGKTLEEIQQLLKNNAKK